MKLIKILLLFVFYHLSTGLAVNETAFANDELYLCGVVKKVNTRERKVDIQVVSEGCAGIKIFKVSTSQQIEKFIIGDDICFKIDMNTCPQSISATIIAK